MAHKTENEEKMKELSDLFLSLDENGQDKALNILRSLTVVQIDTLSEKVTRQGGKEE